MNKFIITEEEKSRIIGMHQNATSKQYLSEDINEQLGSDIKAAAKGLGARVGTIAQNLGKAVGINKSDRTLQSPELNAQMAKIKSKVQSFQKIIDGLNTDIAAIQQVAKSQMTGQYQPEATQINTLITNYSQLLGNLTQYNNSIINQQQTQQQTPTQQPTQQPTQPQAIPPQQVA